MRAEMLKSQVKNESHTSQNIVQQRSKRQLLISTLLYVTYELICIASYIIVEAEFQTPEKQQLVQRWSENYAVSCHAPLDLSKSLQAVVLYGCGYVSFSYSAYVFTIYRQRILRYSSVPIQDFDALNYNGFEASLIGKIFIRLILIAPVAAVAIAPS